MGAKRKGLKAAPNRWTRDEIEVVLSCLGSADFMERYAETIPAGAFPELEVRDACINESEYHNLCVAISKEVLARAGEHNNNNQRPFGSIANKIQDMLARARHEQPGVDAKEAFQNFDVDAFCQQSSIDVKHDDELKQDGESIHEPNGEPGAEAGASEPSGAEEKGARSASAAGAADGAPEYDDTYVAPVRNGRDITFQTRILNPHLVCHLCMGYFKDACTIIECLHTFCRSCIHRHFRDSNVCPTCDTKLGTDPKALVRTDRTLQSIVDKVFPEFAKKDSAPKRQSSPPADDRPAKAAREGSGSWASSSAAQGQAAEADAAGQQQEISFSLQEANAQVEAAVGTRLEKPYLRTSVRLTVAHLKKYLAKKMRLTEGVGIDILCRDVLLPMEMTLEAIAEAHWKDVSEDLVLKYQVTALDAA